MQCHVCGLRWGDDPSHRALFDQHLDIHFRKARRSQDPSFRRSLARQWYPINETEWKLLRLTGEPADINVTDEKKPPKQHQVVPKRTRHEGIDPNYSDEENGDNDNDAISKHPRHSSKRAIPPAFYNDDHGGEDDDDDE